MLNALSSNGHGTDGLGDSPVCVPRGLYSAFLPLVPHGWCFQQRAFRAAAFMGQLTILSNETWKALIESDNAFWKMDGEIFAMHNTCFTPRTKPKVILAGCQ